MGRSHRNDSGGLDDHSGAPDASSNLTVDFGFVPKIVDLALTKQVDATWQTICLWRHSKI
ncbi:MAG: hypothetical protein IPO25_22830 [Saprospiraceae bacterium]|nr:hypothetical protein [Saprospiraceae bacterium]